MNLSRRSVVALAQFLHLQPQDVREALFEKHGLSIGDGLFSLDSIRTMLFGSECGGLMEEIARTEQDLRIRVNPRTRFHERMEDLKRCVELDGYRLDGDRWVEIEPVFFGVSPLNDELSLQLVESMGEWAGRIQSELDQSADAFRRTPSDHAACMTHARIAMETLVKRIAVESEGADAEDLSWGRALHRLRELRVITAKEEDALSGAYAFLSDGAHRPFASEDREIARLGRSLATSMCYFLVLRRRSTQR